MIKSSHWLLRVWTRWTEEVDAGTIHHIRCVLDKGLLNRRTSSERTACRFCEMQIAKAISQSGNWGTERPLSGFRHTCWCNLNLYFWGELFLTLWPCYAHWTLTMTDLSAAFLLWSLAQEWRTGRELLCRPDRSGFLFRRWAMMGLISLDMILLFGVKNSTNISTQTLLRWHLFAVN